MFVSKAFAAVFAAVGLLVQPATGMFIVLFTSSEYYLVNMAGLKHIRRRGTLYPTLAVSTMP